jgi:hypothetical protein
MGGENYFPGDEATGYEADCSPPSSEEVKNAWSYTSIPLYIFMACFLIKQRDNFTFHLFVWFAYMSVLKPEVT